MRKIGFKVLPVISLLLIGGFLATILAGYYVSRASLRSQIATNELPITSDNIYSEIQRDLLRPIFISSLMSHDTFLRDWVINGEKDPDEITRYLKEIQDKYGTFTSFFVSDNSRIYYHSKGILKRISPDEVRDVWYFRVRDMQTEYETNVDIDMANRDAMTIFINYRVYDYDRNFIGATGVGLMVNAVNSTIEKYQQKYGRKVYFTDRDGEITLFGPSFGRNPGNLRDLPGISSLAETILSSQNNSLGYRNEGETYYVNSRYIPELDWYLIVEQSDSRAILNIHHALLVNLLIGSVITMVVLLMTYLTISNYQARVEKLATTDKLTGIYNRQAFDAIIEQTLKDAQRRGVAFSIIICDIDNFKRVNDSFGHLAGDAVIRHITDICRANTRNSDVLCRWGGEEFVILLRECTLEDAFRTAEKIRCAVAESPIEYGNGSCPATISLGVAQYKKDEDLDGMLRRADAALYRAKKNGRNCSERDCPALV